MPFYREDSFMSAKLFDIEPIHKTGIIEAKDFGAKAVQLRSLTNLGLPVPAGFFISKGLVGKLINAPNTKISKEFKNLDGLYALRASPSQRDWGSIDAILNLGMNDAYVIKIAGVVGKKKAQEIYRRFIHNYSIAVYGLEPEMFESIYYDEMRSVNVTEGDMLDENTLSSIVEASKNKFKLEVGNNFPESLEEQLDLAFLAMSRSWYRPSVKILRAARGAPSDAGVGIILQEMAFGIGPNVSGSGQINMIDRETGETKITGFFMPNSQGPDSMLSSRSMHAITEQQRKEQCQIKPSLESMHLNSYEIIKNVVMEASLKFGEAFQFQFIIDQNNFYILDLLIAERSARASVKVVVDLVSRNALTKEQALLKVEPHNLVEFLHPQISPTFVRKVVGVGLPASPGAVSGRVAFSSHSARVFNAKGEPAILVRVETSPEDISGIHDSVGVLTCRGGMTSHAAVIARGLGLPCVVGVSSLAMNISEKMMISDIGQKFREGDLITLDGSVGEVLDGFAEMTQPEISGAFSNLMDWADQYRCMAVRGNADTPEDAQLAKDFGADGIGLCRTEHMFFEQKRLLVMQEMILADGEVKRREALSKLLPMQRDDFIKFFQIMKGKPVTIRLLDPPLHEFLPNSDDEMIVIAHSMNLSIADVRERSKDLKEFNPMLGKRGVRLGITMPEIYEMQSQAIFEAAMHVNKEGLYEIVPEIMIPLVSAKEEVAFISKRIKQIYEGLKNTTACRLAYKLGVVVETPRAALKAKDLSGGCEFLSFGTNDLTQMTYGLSRDDAGRFMRDYLEKGVFPSDPFHSLDLDGVGELILMASRRARKAKKTIELGLCGEHGGDPNSIKFCLAANFDYISCSPFRIPIARLAAAQASILQKQNNF